MTRRADRDDLTGELVTEDHRRDGEDGSVIPLGRVGPADRGPGHLQLDLVVGGFGGPGNVLDRQQTPAPIDRSPHEPVLMWTLMFRCVSLAAS